MRTVAIIAAVALVILIGFIGVYIFLTNSQSSEKIFTFQKSDLPIIESHPLFFEHDNFQKAVSDAEKIQTENNIDAIIVPQHLLASSLIAEQIKRASGRNISTVIIVGPNHFNTGVQKISSAKASWKTQFGNVNSQIDLVDKFMTDLSVIDEPETFINEHAVGAIVPFIKHYLPKAEILPIAFNSYATLQDAEKVSNWLAGNIPENTLIIYSIDFSHYLSREEADIKDKETNKFIDDGNLNKIMSLGNDHLDSPASLATALLYADQQNLHPTILSINNSDDFSVVRTPETTSYFIITFSKDKMKEINDSAVLMFVGDIMLSRYVGDVMEEKQDWLWPFRNISEYTNSADILFGNLEGPISERGQDVGSIYSFRADPHVIEGLTHVGFDAVSVANNHIGDWGRVALEDTLRILNENQILPIGGGYSEQEAHTVKIIEVGETTFGFLAYTPLAPPSIYAHADTAGITIFSEDNMIRDIKNAVKSTDVVIVSLHYGDEYDSNENATQIDLSRLAIDSGANLVVGHHPHVIQGIEKYKNGLIAYSLGNFIFDQSFSEETESGIILKTVFNGDQLIDIEEVDTEITKDFQVFLLDE